MSSEELGQASAQEALQPLRAAVEAAGSSLSLPHVLHKAGPAGGPSDTHVLTLHSRSPITPPLLVTDRFTPHLHGCRMRRVSSRW